MFGLGGWVMGGMGLALVASLGALAWKDSQVSERDKTIGRIVAERDQLADLAAANAAAAQEAARLARQHEAATVALLDQRSQRQAMTKTIIREVYRDKPIHVAPGCPALSPVLDDALERLRQLRAGENDPGNPGPARPDTRAVADLRR